MKIVSKLDIWNRVSGPHIDQKVQKLISYCQFCEVLHAGNWWTWQDLGEPLGSLVSIILSYLSHLVCHLSYLLPESSLGWHNLFWGPSCLKYAQWCRGCLFFFWLCYVACRILVLRPRIKPTPPVVEVWSLNHWIGREVPEASLLIAPFM